MNRTTSTRTRLGVAVAAAGVAAGTLVPMASAATASAAPARAGVRLSAASHRPDEVSDFLARAAQVDRSLKGYAAAVNASFRKDGTAVTTRAADRASVTVFQQMLYLGFAFPTGARGELRERLLRLYADLDAREWAMHQFQWEGVRFREYPGPRLHGSHDLAMVRRHLARGHVFAVRYRKDVAAVRAALRRQGSPAHVSTASRNALDNRVMLKVITLSTWGPSYENMPAGWSGRPLRVRWTDSRGNVRKGVITAQGRRQGVRFTIEAADGHWFVTEIEDVERLR